MLQKENIEIGLEENALDSLKHGIEHFVIDKRNTDLKYAILHIAHSVELFVKARLAKEHFLLIFTKPENSTDDDKTVTLDEAIKRLEAVKIKFNEDSKLAFNELQKTRNRVQHYKLTFSKEEIKNIIGRSIKYLEIFLNQELNIVLRNNLSKDTYEVLADAIFSYEELLAKAKEEMNNYLPSGKERLDYKIDICSNCGNQTIIYPVSSRKDENHLVECFFCHQEFEVGECSRCGRVIYGEETICVDCWKYVIMDSY